MDPAIPAFSPLRASQPSSFSVNSPQVRPVLWDLRRVRSASQGEQLLSGYGEQGFGGAGRPNVAENEYDVYQILHRRRLCCCRHL